VSRGELEPGFDAYVWTAEVGAISDVIETSYGFHIIQVLERHISAAEEYEADLDRKARELLEKRQRESSGATP
jgi:parvulin-like peptidyl-prolyl isomerase